MGAARLDSASVEREIASLSRAPFRSVLLKLLQNGPSDEAISNQAERSPEKWAQTIQTIARLTGYTDTLKVEGTFEMRVQEMSDMELEAQILALKILDQPELLSSGSDGS